MRKLYLATVFATGLISLASAQTVSLGSLTPAQSYPNSASVLLRVPSSNGYAFGLTTPAAIVAAGISNDYIAQHCSSFTSTVPGCVPASGGGSANFLRADGVWAQPPGGSGGGSSYTLPAATAAALGGVKASASIAVASDGTASLAQAGAATGQVLSWNGSAWLPATPASGGGGATITPVTTQNCTGSLALAYAATGNNAYNLTLAGSCALSLSGGVSGQLQTLTLVIRGGGGGYTATLPTGIKWPGGVAPTVDTSANSYNEFVIKTLDAGATYSGNY